MLSSQAQYQKGGSQLSPQAQTSDSDLTFPCSVIGKSTLQPQDAGSSCLAMGFCLGKPEPLFHGF